MSDAKGTRLIGAGSVRRLVGIPVEFNAEAQQSLEDASQDETEIERLSQLLLSQLVPGARPIKTAMLIVRSLGVEELPSEFRIDAALQRLSTHPEVQVDGSIENWRASEVRRMATFEPTERIPDNSE